jgi:hypothetical protein
MKEVYVLERANSNEEGLTNKGKQECLALKYRVPKFDIVISSKESANVITAKTITGKTPTLDSRAGGVKTLSWWKKSNNKSTLPSKYGGVNVLEKYRKPAKEVGEKLIDLIHSILKKLPDDGKALIISHNRTMIAAEAILHKEKMVSIANTFHELQGFMIDEEFTFQKIDGFMN